MQSASFNPHHFVQKKRSNSTSNFLKRILSSCSRATNRNYWVVVLLQGGGSSLQDRSLFVQQSPSLPTQSQSEPGATTQNQWDATSATARTEPESAVCTLCTQWMVDWPATIMFEVFKSLEKL